MSDAIHSRREFLGIGAGAVAAAHGISPHRRRRPARHRPADPLHQIEHIVVVTQENASFDHYFGTLRGVRGFSDPGALTLPDGRSVFRQPVTPAGPDLLPWRYDTVAASPCDLFVDNSWAPTHRALDHGKMDGWMQGEDELVDLMSYYTRAELPWHYALADAFTVGDAYFASVLGPTHPNRLMLMTGTIDPLGVNGGPDTDNSDSTAYTWVTYPERLQAAGVSWRVYQEADNFDDNMLERFKAFQTARPGSPLYENGMVHRSPSAFEDDVAAGRLPQVSWLISNTRESEHPGNAPGPGADYCNRIMQALFAHPKVWAKTVVILNYDEPGGYFDHVRPPLPPAGTPDEFIKGEPIGLGFRVPLVVCSPWSRGGFVCSDTFDHTSTIRLIERRFGVREPQISAWRRRTCGDLTACLDLHHPDFTIPSLPATAPLVIASDASCRSSPPGMPPLLSQSIPQQEPGTRPRRPQRS